jgi:SAM-dependent methyltransferase
MTEPTTTEPSTRLSPSVARGLSLGRKLSEGVQLFRLYRREARAGHDFGGLFAELDEYDELLRAHAGVALADAKVFEIGFGARPYRQMALQSMGVDVRGVDAEAPALSGGAGHYVEMLRRNGAERAAKSLVRHLLFDRGEERALDRALRERGVRRRLDPSRLVVADAGAIELEESSLDLVFSEDVFEHMERETLGRVIAAIARWLRPGGLALVRPNVFTGITGGHLIEWSRRALRQPPPSRRSEPWEHLRQRRYAPNTYLNELTRTDYRALFAPYFEIVAERVTQPGLGSEHLDERARAELSAWPEEELFSNQTLFVLRPRKA